MCVHSESISPMAIKRSVLIPRGRKCQHFHLFLSHCHLIYILCIFLNVIIYQNSNAYIIISHNIIRSLTVEKWKYFGDQLFRNQKIIKICCIKCYLIWGSLPTIFYETSSTEERQNIQNIHVCMSLHRASEMETFLKLGRRPRDLPGQGKT